MSIYVITHKSYDFPSSKLYKPLVVGKAINNVDLHEHAGVVYDDVADNISHRNREYCELTGLYWLWKNSDEKYLGVCHYRRYFASNTQSNIDDSCSVLGKQVISEPELEQLLEQADMIVPTALFIGPRTVFSQFINAHYVKDILLLKDIINMIYPDYSLSFEQVMNQSILYPFNMFIAKKEVFNKYCEWLFSILFFYEKKNNISEYDSYQRRLYGFLAERLFTVWIVHNYTKYIIRENDVVTTEIIPLPKASMKDIVRLKWNNFKYLKVKFLSILMFNLLK